jgi:lysophospholipase L1-like esterase
MFWYEEEVKSLEGKQTGNTSVVRTIFYGSSSIRLWNTLEKDFESYNPVNLGFGGSTLAACAWFFKRIVLPYKADRFVVYAGDNDIGDGRLPEEVFVFFQQLTVLIDKNYGKIPCYFISIKPSFARWNLDNNIKYTNGLIESEIVKRNDNWHFINIYDKMIDASGFPNRQFFDGDGLHLSADGYQIWKQTLQKAFASSHLKSLT